MSKVMDVNDFINRIIALYPHLAGDTSVRFDYYKRVLPVKNIDYDKLFDIFCNEFEEKGMPKSNWFKDKLDRCKIVPVVEGQKWLHVKVFNPLYNAVTSNDCFPSGTTEQQMIKTYEKMFPRSKGWKIIEVY